MESKENDLIVIEGVTQYALKEHTEKLGVDVPCWVGYFAEQLNSHTETR